VVDWRGAELHGHATNAAGGGAPAPAQQQQHMQQQQQQQPPPHAQHHSQPQHPSVVPPWGSAFAMAPPVPPGMPSNAANVFGGAAGGDFLGYRNPNHPHAPPPLPSAPRVRALTPSLVASEHTTPLLALSPRVVCLGFMSSYTGVVAHPSLAHAFSGSLHAHGLVLQMGMGLGDPSLLPAQFPEELGGTGGSDGLGSTNPQQQQQQQRGRGGKSRNNNNGYRGGRGAAAARGGGAGGGNAGGGANPNPNPTLTQPTRRWCEPRPKRLPLRRHPRAA
jgi:hypothetical protein